MKTLLKSLFSNSGLSNNKQSSEKNTDIHIAVAALMIEVLSADQNIDPRETKHSLKILAQYYAIDNTQLEQHLKNAQEKQQTAVDLHQFTRQICEDFTHKQRLALLTQLWEIAFIDEQLDRHERHTIRKIAALLHLNDKEIAQTRERAKSQIAKLP